MRRHPRTRWLLPLVLVLASLLAAGQSLAARDTRPPTAPSGLTAVSTTTGVTLTWKASTDNVGVKFYVVTVATQTKRPTAPKAAFANLRPNTSYTARVQAVDAAGNRSTAVRLAFRTKARDTTPPSAPGAITTAPEITGATISWGAASDNIGVTAYVLTVDGRSQTLTARTATVTGLRPNTSYLASVLAKDAAGNTSPAVSATFRTLPEPDVTPPSVPGSPTVTPGSTQATLNWTPSTDNVGVSGYVVAVAGLAEQTVTATTATLDGLTPDTTYTATIVATDAAGNRSAAAEATFTTLPPPDTTAPSEPTALAVTGQSTTTGVVTWTAATDDVAVTGYLVTAAGRTQEVSGTSATVTDLPVGTTTAVAVVAVDAAGNRSTAGRINVRTLLEPDTQAPSSPEVSVVPGSTRAAVTVAEARDDVGVVRYVVTVAGQSLSITEPGTLTVTGLLPARDHQLRVTARDASGNVSPVTIVAFPTLPAGATPDGTPPTPPTNLSVRAGSSTLQLTWSPASDNVDVDRYVVTVGDIIREESGHTLTLDGLAPQTPYDVVVVAVDTSGNASAPVTGQAVTRPGPSNAQGLRGTIAWFGKNTSRATMDEALASPLVDGLSVYLRWSDITTDGVTFNWSLFETARQAASAAGKPWNGMIIYGVVGNGMPAYVTDGLLAGQLITIDGETFPTFWSPQAQAAARDLVTAAAQRFGSDPNLVQWRVTGLWSVNAEPRILGGAPGRRTWVDTYRIEHPGATFEDVQAAYNDYEKHIWAEAAAAWPTRITLAQAGGLALADNVDTLPNTDPAKHPQRLATWGEIRARLGARMVGQFNGVDAGSGAGGFGEWLPIAFGPNGFYPGRVGAQSIGGVSQDTRLTADDFREMVRLLTVRGYSYGELYGSDVIYALRGRNAEALHMRATLEMYHDGWTP